MQSDRSSELRDLLARRVRPDLDGHALADVCAALGVVPRAHELCPGREWHDALFDAFAGALARQSLRRDRAARLDDQLERACGEPDRVAHLVVGNGQAALEQRLVDRERQLARHRRQQGIADRRRHAGFVALAAAGGE